MQIEVAALICDFILFFIIIMAGINGYKNGMVSKLLMAFSWLIALLLAYVFHAQLASLLANWGLTDKLAASITKAITPEMLSETEAAAEPGKLSSLLPEILRGRWGSAYETEGVGTYFEYVGLYLGRMIVNAIAVFVIFLVSLFILQFIANHLTFVNKIPLVGFVNKVLGFALEAIIAILILQFILMILTALSTVHPVIPSILNTVEKSFFGKLLYEHNLFMKWILAVK